MPRTVLCFLNEGYLANLECVYYDDAKEEWPDPARCAVLLRDDEWRLQSVTLPSGATVRPTDPDDRFWSFEVRDGGGFCSTTLSGYREYFGADGSSLGRAPVE